jgi:hypothetical protein
LSQHIRRELTENLRSARSERLCTLSSKAGRSQPVILGYQACQA